MWECGSVGRGKMGGDESAEGRGGELKRWFVYDRFYAACGGVESGIWT
jgi:hypothetical protein